MQLSSNATDLLALAEAPLRAPVLLLQLRGALGGGGFGLATGGRAARGAAVPAAAAPLLLRGVRRRVAAATPRRPPELVPVPDTRAPKLDMAPTYKYHASCHEPPNRHVLAMPRSGWADRMLTATAADGRVSCTMHRSAHHLDNRGATQLRLRLHCDKASQVAHLPSPMQLQCFRRSPAGVWNQQPALSKASSLCCQNAV
jgi:hypothetical protein